MNAALEPWLALLRCEGIGAVGAGRLLERFGSAQVVFDAGPAGWRNAGVPEAAQRGLAAPDRAGIERDLAWLGGAPRRSLVTRGDSRYPSLLAQIPGAPPALFCHGDTDLLRLPQIAIVGSRQATPQGLENAKAFAAELARRGLTVTSGLALGIDGAAHRGALTAQGLSIGVCATGLDRIYPARHRELAHQLIEQGLLVSEFPVGVAALAEHFPRRNRIISGLALGVLVVEAAPESGSLITARYALEQGREVFAIPGSIHNPVARGCHALIRQGAKLVETIDDILGELAPQLPRAADSAAAAPGVQPAADALQQRVLTAIGDAGATVDALAERLGEPVAALSVALLGLELEGRIAGLPGGAYQQVFKS